MMTNILHNHRHPRVGGDPVRGEAAINKDRLTAMDQTPAYAGVAYLLMIGTILFAFSLPAFAVEPDEMLKDPALEARARTISKDLRCLVCQGQAIDDSDADLAKLWIAPLFALGAGLAVAAVFMRRSRQ
jgi:cytochrome c-type biogenesis protein CcmH/NrfF